MEDARGEMREESRRIQTVVDRNGAHWVYLSPHEAAAHPKGRPGLALWLVAAWFAAAGGLEIALAVGAGAPLWSGGLGALSLLAGLGLVLRVPWAYVLAVLLPARFVIGFVQTVSAAPPPLTGDPELDMGFVLLQAVIAIVVMFYLLEGERPNLVYRHRFRSYRAERQVAEGEAAAEAARKGEGGS